MDEVLIDRIRKVLRQNPRGLHIGEIAARLKVGRDSIIKYLEVLEASGLVESNFHGNARVFYAARRVPASTLLDLSSDLVCTLDSQQSFVFTNQKFLKFFGLSENEVVGQKILEIRCEGRIDPVFTSLFSDLPAGEEEVRETLWQTDGKDFRLKIRSIPTIFEDGSKGATILLEDITREWKYIMGLEFLALTARDLTEMGDDENIYQYIADRIYDLEPGSTLCVCSLDAEKQTLTIRGVAGDPAVLDGCRRILGNLKGITFPFKNEPRAAEALMKRTLQKGSDLYSMLFRSIPHEVVAQIEEQISFGEAYTIGCVCRGGIFGNVAIMVKHGHEIQHKKLIETFLGQAAVALQRRHMREKLREAEEIIVSLKERIMEIQRNEETISN